jgi:hypothetical protein
MIARWFCFAVLELLLSAVAVILSPLLALCAVTRDSHPYCSAKGPRQYLWGWLHLCSTHWAGRGAPWFMQHMLIKELTIMPFPDESGFERRIVETYPNDVFRDFKPPGY